jgi:hypothetical protein
MRCENGHESVRPFRFELSHDLFGKARQPPIKSGKVFSDS